MQTWSFRGSKSRNKVSVGEPAEGSLLFKTHQWVCEVAFCVTERAFEIAHFLKSYSQISSIYYPGLKDHLNHKIAKNQQLDPNGKSVFGGMISIDLGSLSAARKFVKNLNIFILAESLGGVESLVCHPATMTHASIPSEIRQELGVTDGLIRLSVGIENLDDLKEDLETAMKK